MAIEYEPGADGGCEPGEPVLWKESGGWKPGALRSKNLRPWPAHLCTLLVTLRNLLANPFNCNCHLAWLGEWLRKKRIVTGNPRCQKPSFLKEIPIQDVAIQDFTCDDGKAPGPACGPQARRGLWGCGPAGQRQPKGVLVRLFGCFVMF